MRLALGRAAWLVWLCLMACTWLVSRGSLSLFSYLKYPFVNFVLKLLLGACRCAVLPGRPAQQGLSTLSPWCRALLVVVGHPLVLLQDASWRELLRCIQ